MTRTSNALRLTLSADIESGEGYLTKKAYEVEGEILEQDYLWVEDVIGDWQGQLGGILELALAQSIGVSDELKRDTEVAKDYTETAHILWMEGVWPSSVTELEYLAGADAIGSYDPNAKIRDYTSIDEYACSDEFFEWINVRAEKMAGESIAEMKKNGVRYPHGRHPSASDLLMFHTLKQLVNGEASEDPIAMRKATKAEAAEHLERISLAIKEADNPVEIVAGESGPGISVPTEDQISDAAAVNWK